MITLGFDIGSRNTKVVLFDSVSSRLLYSDWIGTDPNPLKSVEMLHAKALEASGNIKVDSIACTGYGRKLLNRSTRIFSEISCHTKGVLYTYPLANTIIDIGGQDSKIITLEENRRVKDFIMNDKCAAGTGRFLEMTAMRLGLDLNELNALEAESDEHIQMNSTCVVFAESEIIGLIAKNTSTSNIVKAVFNSIAQRVVSQIRTMDYQEPIVFTGGVAQSFGLVRTISSSLNSDILVPPDPEITGALGAAILAAL